ncbi:stealth family protein [Tessaracoccus lacteus]|uniref:Stealth CR1 domain-containing protein n=1 Tax=Tessaracoccus lacteus TaxID=3041766 RepID=A0ABY8PX18_9ACTN|nr:stealth family protein [Tessaracoccus sp. T21]WGT47040.1 Stealth CR1 domain-containing protein [Tessaracoccus sp. T21]
MVKDVMARSKMGSMVEVLGRPVRLLYGSLSADSRRFVRSVFAGARGLLDRRRSHRAYRRVVVPVATSLPYEIAVATMASLQEALAANGVESWLVSSETDPAAVLGVNVSDHEDVSRAVLSLAGKGYWLWAQGRRYPLEAIDRESLKPLLIAPEASLTIYTPRDLGGSGWIVGEEYGCGLEIWRRENEAGVDYMLGPRENRASRQLAPDDFRLQPAQWHGVPCSTPAALGRRMLDDVDFPIDVVYTWVDGDDPDWLSRRAAAMAESEGVPYHPEATMESRFTSRDELKYSLRSLDYFAPWVRRIYLVTDRQVPSWLDTENPRIRVVDHREIFRSEAYLPSFNSNAIISNIHHIEGLAEHYIYINDDVFLGCWLRPQRFFLGSGVALVSPANNRRKFGPATSNDEPHFNLTRNMRTLLQEAFGLTISRAIKHTPHPQLRSVNHELEERFREAYVQTWGHAFRHHSDIVADQLHHYFAQLTGRAVPGNLKYTYVNLKDRSHAPRLERLMLRDREVFCLNDAPVPDQVPIDPDEVQRFLDAYYPVPSTFELTDPGRSQSWS